METWRQHHEKQALGPNADTLMANGYVVPGIHHVQMACCRRILGAVPAGAVVLDAGCGNGLTWRALLAETPVVGIDFSIGMCALARRRGMPVSQADVANLPFAADTFDLVYSTEVIQCVEDLAACLVEFARVCKPGGRILISTLNRAGVLLRLLRFAARTARAIVGAQQNPEQLFMRRASEIAAVARSLSLEVQNVGWINYPLPWTPVTRSPASVVEPLAWKIVVELVKPPSVSR